MLVLLLLLPFLPPISPLLNMSAEMVDVELGIDDDDAEIEDAEMEDADRRAERPGAGARGSQDEASKSDVEMSRACLEDDGGEKMLMKMVEKRRSGGGIDVIEVYSPERVAKFAREPGLTGGQSMDLLESRPKHQNLL